MKNILPFLYDKTTSLVILKPLVSSKCKVPLIINIKGEIELNKNSCVYNSNINKFIPISKIAKRLHLAEAHLISILKENSILIHGISSKKLVAFDEYASFIANIYNDKNSKLLSLISSLGDDNG